MTKEQNNYTIHNRDTINRLIDELTLFDDDFMRRVFDKNRAAVGLVLNIILNKKLRILNVRAQYNMNSRIVDGHNVTLDIHAVDEERNEMDIEVQCASGGAHERRARYHSSLMDSGMLKKGQDFRELKDSYVIFIYKHDKFREGLPIYHVDRYVSETHKPFKDGSHIIYVNGNYRGDDPIGLLIKDFHQTDPDMMHYDALADGAKYFKKSKEGRKIMCEAVEKYGDERERHGHEAGQKAGQKIGERKGATSANLNAVKNLMVNMKLTLDQALDTLGLQGKERSAVLKQMLK